MKKLFLIPARGGSKGLPRKNILPLAGKPLICHTVDTALELMKEGDELCVSTDDYEIIELLKNYGISVPFVRPVELSTDSASSRGVILHALEFYSEVHFDIVVYLQPTSPFRSASNINDCIKLFNKELDMVASVRETKSNPYFNLYEEDENGFIKLSKRSNIIRRQDCPPVWELNGAVYIINPSSIISKNMNEFEKIKKYPMDATSSLDIDTNIDWITAVSLIKSNNKI